jgi:hypothetical protein
MPLAGVSTCAKFRAELASSQRTIHRVKFALVQNFALKVLGVVFKVLSIAAHSLKQANTEDITPPERPASAERE